MFPYILGPERSPGVDVHPVKAIELVGDPVVMKILVATSDRNMSVAELAPLVGLSQATAYRKVDSLLKKGLLRSMGRKLTQSGKRQTVFRASIKGLQISFDGGKLRMRFDLESDVPRNEQTSLDGMWNVVDAIAA